MKRNYLFFVLPLILCSTTANGQPTTQGEGDQKSVESAMADEMKQARALQGDEQWVEAAELYMQITEAQPDNGAAWFNLGYCLHAAGELELAMSAHRKAATFDEFTGIALYNLGCAQSLRGELDDALKTLIASHEAGFDVGGNLDSDSDLVNLQEHPHYDKLVEMTGGGGAGDNFMSALMKARKYLEQNGPALMQQAKAMAQQAAGMMAQKVQEIKELSSDEEKMGAIKQQLGAAFARAHQAFLQWRESLASNDKHDSQTETAAKAESTDEEASYDIAEVTEEAESAFGSSNWKEAAEAYAIVVKAQPDDGQAWFRLGYALHLDGQIEAALKAHKHAAEFDTFKGIALYNVACAYSLLGDADASIKALEKCQEAGFDRISDMIDDADFDNIRDDPRFVAMVEALDGDGD